MTNAELIKALRYCAEHEGCDYYIAKECPREITWMCGVDCNQILMLDAAAALKAADKRIARLEEDLKTREAEREVMQDTIKICEEAADRYKAQIPKEGEWIIDGMNEYELSYGCVGYEPIYRCSKCGITTESYLRTERPIMPEDADFPNYCPNCGARMDGAE